MLQILNICELVRLEARMDGAAKGEDSVQLLMVTLVIRDGNVFKGFHRLVVCRLSMA